MQQWEYFKEKFESEGYPPFFKETIKLWPKNTRPVGKVKKDEEILLCKIVGTDHINYANQTWGELLLGQSTGGRFSSLLEIIRTIEELKEIFVLNKKNNETMIVYYLKEKDEYYIAQGNHKLATYKCYAFFEGIKTIKVDVCTYEYEKGESFFGKIKSFFRA